MNRPDALLLLRDSILRTACPGLSSLTLGPITSSEEDLVECDLAWDSIDSLYDAETVGLWYTGQAILLTGAGQNSIGEEIVCVTQAEGNRYFLASERHLYSARLSGNALTDIHTMQVRSIDFFDYIYYHQPSGLLVINSPLEKSVLYKLRCFKLCTTLFLGLTLTADVACDGPGQGQSAGWACLSCAGCRSC